MTFRFYSPMVALSMLVTGCAGLPGGSTPVDTFALSEPPSVQVAASARNRQILIAEPNALRTLAGDEVLVRTSPSEVQYLAGSQWNDRLPLIVQAQLIHAFENTDRLGGVARSGDGLAIDFQLVPTIRKFEIVAYGAPRAEVELSVSVLNDRNGVVRAQRVFSASAPLSGSQNEDYVVSLDRAFEQVIVEMVPWAMQYF